MPDEPDHFLQITALGVRDGEFLPLPAPAYRLEFIGDSITSGEGAIGAKQEEDWVSAFFSAVPHYARLTAEALGAEWRIISQSGWGLLSGWDNDPRHRVMDYYEQVCGVAAGAHNAALGARQPYDFAAWPADAVIITPSLRFCALEQLDIGLLICPLPAKVHRRELRGFQLVCHGVILLFLQIFSKKAPFTGAFRLLNSGTKKAPLLCDAFTVPIIR